jgi:hypothetical protein
LFKPLLPQVPSAKKPERIATALSETFTQVIESVAWDVVPEITTKLINDELKRQS